MGIFRALLSSGCGSQLLEFTGNGASHSLADEAYDTLAEYDVANTSGMESWIDYFQQTFDVFFSRPLDLDFALLEAFTDVYQGLVTPPRRGPTMPEASPAARALAVKAFGQCSKGGGLRKCHDGLEGQRSAMGVMTIRL